MGRLAAALKHSQPAFKVNELRIKLAHLDGFSSGADGGDERHVVEIEPRKDVGHHVIVGERLSCRCHLVAERFHAPDVLGHRRVALLRHGESDSGVDDVRLSLGDKDLRDGDPSFGRRVAVCNLDHHRCGD